MNSPLIDGKICSVDLRLAIVQGGTPEPNRFNHLTYIVGFDGLSTSVGFSTTVETDGGIPFCDTIDPDYLTGFSNYSPIFRCKTSLIDLIVPKRPF